jgi:hypothetical protein
MYPNSVWENLGATADLNLSLSPDCLESIYVAVTSIATAPSTSQSLGMGTGL